MLSEQKFPNSEYRMSTGAVVAADVDQDGDQDLFVGERLKIGAYGLPGSGFLLENDGQGNFTDVTQQKAPQFKDLGLITDALFFDMDQDEDQDLLIVGEFMGITFFENQEGQFVQKANHPL